jgi:putative cardiolipin synthase
MGVVFESPQLAGRLGEAFDNNADRQAYRVELKKVPASQSLTGFDDWTLEWVTLEDGAEVRYAVEPETSWWQRFTVGLMSPFIIESFL